MSNRAAWVAGLGAGLSWTTAINTTDLVSLASGSTVLSSIADIDNEANLDMFAEISLRLTVSSFTPSSGSYLGIYVVPLLDDGSTYGDGTLTSGSTITRAPPYPLAGIVPLESSAAITVMAGFIPRIELPPNKFRFALFNNSGVSLSGTAGNNIVKYRTYDMNLNA
jgi:hypothetical protein